MTDDEIIKFVTDIVDEAWQTQLGAQGEDYWDFDAAGGIGVNVFTDKERLRNPKPGAERMYHSSIDRSSRGVEGLVSITFDRAGRRVATMTLHTFVECRLGRMPKIEQRLTVSPERKPLEDCLLQIKLAR